jgi:ABC-type branched-subunit amino acid transport system ATPase component
MPDRYITAYDIKGIACLRHVQGPLTPLHAFIGPNDSGKSSLLRALRTAMFLSRGTFSFQEEDDGSRRFLPFEPVPLATKASITLQFQGTNAYYRMTVGGGYEIGEDGGPLAKHARPGRPWLARPPSSSISLIWPREIAQWLEAGTRLVHFFPGALREASELIPEGEPQTLRDEYGHGLPGVYDVIFSRGDDSVQQLLHSVRRLFPTVKSLRLKNQTKSTKALEIELTSGERVPAAQLSEGLLFYLAFAALQHLDPVALLLVEEPENGLHPSRIADVMRILREISKTTQVVLATHSPLVINEMQGDEVTLVTRDPKQGTQVRLLSSTPHFAERSKVYALGELWLSYANGLDEAPLLRDDRSDAP